MPGNRCGQAAKGTLKYQAHAVGMYQKDTNGAVQGHVVGWATSATAYEPHLLLVGGVSDVLTGQSSTVLDFLHDERPH